MKFPNIMLTKKRDKRTGKKRYLQQPFGQVGQEGNLIKLFLFDLINR
jgi:hypothetical protein